MKAKRKKPLNKKTFLIFTFLGFLIFSFIYSLFKSSRWDGKGRFTVVINSSPISFLSLEPQSKSAVFTVIGDNTILDVPYGYSQYPAYSVFKLGELDKKRGGALLLSKSLELTLGLIVNGFININNNSLKISLNKDEDFEKLKKNYFSYASWPKILPVIFNNQLQTDINPVDLIRIWWTLKNLRSDRFKFLDLEKADIFDEEKWPDGSIVNTVDKNRFDDIYKEYYEDQKIRSENISIEIVNATGKEKIASLYGRILSKIGANVLIKNTGDKDEKESCLIFLTDQHFSKSAIVNLLKNKYSCKVSNNLINRGQSDIKIILGEDFLK